MMCMLIRKVASLVAILALASSPAFACSFSYTGPYTEVARDLTVVVRFEGKPLAGASVDVWGSGNKLSKSTAADGTARFTNLASGQYLLAATHLDVTAGADHIEVRSKGTGQAKAKLEYRWGENPIEVRQIAGALITSESGANVIRQVRGYLGFSFPVDGANVELQHAIDGSVFKTKSDAAGKFIISGVPDGTYRLHLSGGRYGESGHWVIRLTRATANRSLRATAAVGGLCGGGYDLVPVH